MGIQRLIPLVGEYRAPDKAKTVESRKTYKKWRRTPIYFGNGAFLFR
jgi:hypothetical protein